MRFFFLRPCDHGVGRQRQARRKSAPQSRNLALYPRPTHGRYACCAGTVAPMRRAHKVGCKRRGNSARTLEPEHKPRIRLDCQGQRA